MIRQVNGSVGNLEVAQDGLAWIPNFGFLKLLLRSLPNLSYYQTTAALYHLTSGPAVVGRITPLSMETDAFRPLQMGRRFRAVPNRQSATLYPEFLLFSQTKMQLTAAHDLHIQVLDRGIPRPHPESQPSHPLPLLRQTHLQKRQTPQGLP
jgi:hypothetical protein